jgi:dCTP deaminase
LCDFWEFTVGNLVIQRLMLGGDVIAKIVHSRRKRVSGTVKRRRPHPAGPSLFPFPLPHMSIQSDRWITQMAKDHGMIEPFENSQVRAGVISYGVSSYGYDMRVAPEFKIFTNVMSSIVDPKNFDSNSFVEFEGPICIVPPNSFALGRSVEYFRIPRNVVTITVGKSTYARCGIITNVTPFEPEWEGFVTLEISNTTPLPAKIYANEGIAQVLFFKGEEEPMVSYKDKKGKYQGQQGVTLPRL